MNHVYINDARVNASCAYQFCAIQVCAYHINKPNHCNTPNMLPDHSHTCMPSDVRVHLSFTGMVCAPL